MRKASVHLGSGLSEERSATTLPHADPRYASEPTSNTHTHTRRYADIQTQIQIQHLYMHSVSYCQTKHKQIVYKYMSAIKIELG